MRKRIFLIGLSLAFAAEITALIMFAMSGMDNPQDTVAVNEAVRSVQNDWESIERHSNQTNLDYVVLDAGGTILYETKPNLSKSINMAISNRDTILDLEADGSTVGKIIIYNNEAKLLQSKKQTAIYAMIAALLVQCAICIGYYLYINHSVIKPFYKLESFAERIAGGNLDIPLEMDRQNLFGAFTESFDIMRSELKKARAAEAKANASKKELVAKLSHDIKTPVASIKAASEVGAALTRDEKVKDTYEQIIRKADQINVLVTNLFAATLEELQELSVAPAYLESKELRALLENADYLHQTVIPDIPDCLIFADRLRLQQVFDNLFANSYKYANTRIEVTIHRESSYLSISMEDYGGGVKAEELPLLKEKFKRGSSTENVDGAGLGLYISDYCMQQMKGRLDIENGQNGLKATVLIAVSGAI